MMEDLNAIVLSFCQRSGKYPTTFLRECCNSGKAACAVRKATYSNVIYNKVVRCINKWDSDNKTGLPPLKEYYYNDLFRSVESFCAENKIPIKLLLNSNDDTRALYASMMQNHKTYNATTWKLWEKIKSDFLPDD